MKPVQYRWKKVEICLPNGEVRSIKAMIPHQRFWPLCEQQFVDGEDYALDVLSHRSMKSHNHYFACIHEAFLNLPPQWAAMLPSEDHLRKYALCKTGFAAHAEYIFDTAKDARVFAQALRTADKFSVIVVTGSAVSVWTAKSQSMRSMLKEEFQASKTAVLDFLAGVIGTKRSELEKAAEQHVRKPKRIAQSQPRQHQIEHQAAGE